MKRKPKASHKMPAARNPFVALAIFMKAGSHRKAEKALRRQDKVLLDSQLSGRASGFYPDGSSSILDEPTIMALSKTHFNYVFSRVIIDLFAGVAQLDRAMAF